MSDICCPPGHSKVAKGIYDRQLGTALFKRLHGTNFTLAPKRERKLLGPGSYTPVTVDEIYRQKSCGKYGRYYQRSKRFPSKTRRSRHSCQTQVQNSFSQGEFG